LPEALAVMVLPGVALLPEALDVVRAAKIPIILGFARIVFVFIIFAS